MVFNSFVFAGFFVIVYAVYLSTMRRVALQNLILLAASYVFYGWWDWRFLSLLIGTTIVDFVAAWWIDRRSPDLEKSTGGSSHESELSAELSAPCFRLSTGVRRLLLAIAIAANLSLLGFFKYFDFFAESTVRLLTALGFETQPRFLRVILPVGISFYTFQSMSYTIDVYRGRLRAARRFSDFALYVSFFPQLVAGPIVRAVDFLPQVTHPRRLSLDQIYEGGYLIFWGLFKKAVIADNLAPLVDRVFSAPHTPSGAEILVAVYAFAVQIYCDFSGYSDMARGCAKTMGFEFDLNFHSPYFATNPAEFWRRWHISLSTWLRDYLYIPLGGSRKGRIRTYVNLMLTMVLGGLWHGAAWTYILWGVYQGTLLCIHRAVTRTGTRGIRQGMAKDAWIAQPGRAAEPFHGPGNWRSAARRVLVWAVFFHSVCLGWLIFRAESVGQIGHLLCALFSPWTWGAPLGHASSQSIGVLSLLLYSLPLIVVEGLQHARQDLDAPLRLPVWVRGPIYACLFYGLVLFGGRVDKPFIYFQF